MLGYHPAMAAQQPIAVVWVNTPRDQWSDDGRALARSQIRAALDWWEVRAEVAFSTSERTITTTTDVLSLNACRDRAWLPDQVEAPVLYLIAYEPTHRALDCDGVVVGDVTELGHMRAIVGGYLPESSTSQAVIAHTVGHIYGAGHAESGIMHRDGATMRDAYEAGIVDDATIAAIGATRRGVAPAHTTSAGTQPGQRPRAQNTAYLYNAPI